MTPPGEPRPHRAGFRPGRRRGTLTGRPRDAGMIASPEYLSFAGGLKAFAGSYRFSVA